MEKKTRRQFTATDKVRILRLSLLEGKPVSEICESEGIHPTLFYTWQKIFFEKGTAAFDNGRSPSEMMAMFQNSQTISGAGLAVVCLVSSGCFPFYPEVFYPEDFRVTPEHEIVMKAGDVLHAKTRNGSITITAGPETERTFRWQGCEWRLKLFARPAPFQGRFGIYRPGDNRLPTCRGLYRINAEECHWHFDSVDHGVSEIVRRPLLG